MYVLGVDGGGTKTQCCIADANGKILGEGFGKEANYQVCGIETARNSIRTAIYNALENASLSLEDISYAVFGLSGADEQVDYDVLVPMCEGLMGTVPHDVMNDTWIGLRSGSDFGVASICGTGGAHAGKNPSGEQIILRNLDYTLGNRGGGSELVADALHYAFRSDEGTYKKTSLENIMPEIFGVNTMDQVSEIIRIDWEVPSEAAFRIPIETFRLASEGDEVSAMLISRMGQEEGRYAAGVIKRLGMADLAVPCVLIGSLFATGNALLVDAYIDEVHKVAPEAFVIIPKAKPVIGALLLATDQVNK